MSKKIPISFNEDDQAKIKELAELLGIAGVYGDTPKVLKFGIILSLSAIKSPGKVYGHLDDENMAMYFNSIQRFEKRQRYTEKMQEIVKKAEKV